uniref:HW11c63 toxin n=1 Tax=Cyriopagopus schmidti TaxID=29017 RepID=A0A023WBI4_CYRSC|nr:HW11c63 toxin [Cyriopagopus schmidti]
MGIARFLSAVLLLSVLLMVTFPALLSAEYHDGRVDICSLPSDSGDCLRFFEMWYFDGTTCTKFVMEATVATIIGSQLKRPA